MKQALAWAIATTFGVGDAEQRRTDLRLAVEGALAPLAAEATVSHVDLDRAVRDAALDRTLRTIMDRIATAATVEGEIFAWDSHPRLPHEHAPRSVVALEFGDGGWKATVAGLITHRAGTFNPERSSLVVCVQPHPETAVAYRTTVGQLSAILLTAQVRFDQHGRSVAEPDGLVPPELRKEIGYAEILSELSQDHVRSTGLEVSPEDLLHRLRRAARERGGALIALPDHIEPPRHWTALHRLPEGAESAAVGWTLFVSASFAIPGQLGGGTRAGAGAVSLLDSFPWSLPAGLADEAVKLEPRISTDWRTLTCAIVGARTELTLGVLKLRLIAEGVARIDVQGAPGRRPEDQLDACRRAAQLVAAWGFRAGLLHRVEATAAADAKDWRTALMEIGFKEEGMMRGYLPEGPDRDRLLFSQAP